MISVDQLAGGTVEDYRQHICDCVDRVAEVTQHSTHHTK